MASYASDEEQIEALKRWWNENGTSLITGIIIVLVVLFGSRQWQSYRLGNAETASDLYESIVGLAAQDREQTLSDDLMAEMNTAYDRLRNEFANSIYSRYAALVIAGNSVHHENYEQAAAELTWVMENPELGFMRSTEPEMLLSARLRLARVRLAQGMAQEALDLVTAVDPGDLAAGYLEAQGDAYLQLGQDEQARSAYERAIIQAPDNAGFIELKLMGIGG